jgi:hypothetical protein
MQKKLGFLWTLKCFAIFALKRPKMVQMARNRLFFVQKFFNWSEIGRTRLFPSVLLFPRSPRTLPRSLAGSLMARMAQNRPKSGQNGILDEKGIQTS